MKRKSLAKIVRRYLLSAAGIAVLLLAFNVIIIALFAVWQRPKQNETSRFDIAAISEGLTESVKGYSFSPESEALFVDRYQWALLLDKHGTGIWSYRLPEEIPMNYTAAQIAQFSRWYLMDYPVTVWEHGGDSLLVLGSPKGSFVKYVEQINRDTLDAMLWLVPVVLLLHIALAIGLAALMGLRMYRSLQPVVAAISDLAEQKPVELPKNGILSELSDKLNRTSQELQRQKAALEKRDQTRTEWIAGVSHDIRTPLSMVMGYACQLEEDVALPLERREQAGIIRRQSRQIKELVENLNLASKLEYGWAPSDVRPVVLAGLIRSLVAEYLNFGWDDKYQILVEIADDADKAKLVADESLLRRAICNLIDNSIRHNEQGCQIVVSLFQKEEILVLGVRDDGQGIPAGKLAVLENDTLATGTGHGLGLQIVKKVAQVHNGLLRVENMPGIGCRISLLF